MSILVKFPIHDPYPILERMSTVFRPRLSAVLDFYEGAKEEYFERPEIDPADFNEMEMRRFCLNRVWDELIYLNGERK